MGSGMAGTGVDQAVEVPAEAAEAQFYFLRDGDGSRRVLEVRDRDAPPAVAARSLGHAADELSMDMRASMLRQAPAVPNWGFRTTNAAALTDQQLKKDQVERRAAEIAAARAAAPPVKYGEQHRVAVPKTFTVIDGFPNVNRKNELVPRPAPPHSAPPRLAFPHPTLRPAPRRHDPRPAPRAPPRPAPLVTVRVARQRLARSYVRDPNPPRACISTAGDLIYSSAPPAPM